MSQHYFDLPALGRSDLKDIYNEPKLYNMRKLGLAKPRKQTEAMAFGSALDAWLCDGKGPDPLDGYFVVPHDSFRTKAAKQRKQDAIEAGYRPEFIITEGGAEKLRCESESQIKRLEACANSIASSPAANKLLLGCQDRKPQTQAILSWVDEESGVAVKSMPDRLIPGLAIPDLKCSAETNLQHFLKQSRNFWYPTQAYMMQRGWQEQAGEILPVSFVVVRSVEPFDVEVYQASTSFLNHGQNMFRLAIRRFQECTESGIWESPTSGQVVEAEAPKYWANDYNHAI